MNHTADAGSEPATDSRARRAAQRVAVVLVLVLLTFGLPVVASSTSAFSTIGVKVAAAAIDNLAVPVYDTRGPGLKNWQARDPDNGWRGPWRYTKSGALIDAESYNTRAR